MRGVHRQRRRQRRVPPLGSDVTAVTLLTGDGALVRRVDRRHRRRARGRLCRCRLLLDRRHLVPLRRKQRQPRAAGRQQRLAIALADVVHPRQHDAVAQAVAVDGVECRVPRAGSERVDPLPALLQGVDVFCRPAVVEWVERKERWLGEVDEISLQGAQVGHVERVARLKRVARLSREVRVEHGAHRREAMAPVASSGHARGCACQVRVGSRQRDGGETKGQHCVNSDHSSPQSVCWRVVARVPR
eukprot:5070847-Prymnesium_polylepis.2